MRHSRPLPTDINVTATLSSSTIWEQSEHEASVQAARSDCVHSARTMNVPRTRGPALTSSRQQPARGMFTIEAYS
jgi:hypothetical protein